MTDLNRTNMQQRIILSVGPLPEWVKKEFLSTFEIKEVEDSSRNEVFSSLNNYDVLAIISRGPVMIDAEVMDNTPLLKAIARTGVGLDTVDINAASVRNIPVLFTPGAMSRAVAEHTLALILATTKDLFGWHHRVLRSDWNQRYQLQNLDLEGATLGIIGLGRIGQELLKLVQGLKLRILATDPYVNTAQFSKEDNVQFVELEKLLEQSDIVTLHTPLNEETRGLINSCNISKFKTGAILINAARGAIIENYDILITALENKQLRCVAMDTLIVEPPDLAHPFFHHRNVLLTAHVAARTKQSQKTILKTMGHDLSTILKGDLPPLENIANPEIF